MTSFAFYLLYVYYRKLLAGPRFPVFSLLTLTDIKIESFLIQPFPDMTHFENCENLSTTSFFTSLSSRDLCQPVCLQSSIEFKNKFAQSVYNSGETL